MFWTIGITESYINSLNLEDNTSSRNFYDLLDTLKNNQNLAIADNLDFRKIQKLNQKISNCKLSPSYQSEIINLFTELMKQSFIEKNEYSKNKFLGLKLESDDDLEFAENMSNKNLIDAILVDKKIFIFKIIKINILKLLRTIQIQEFLFLIYLKISKTTHHREFQKEI